MGLGLMTVWTYPAMATVGAEFMRLFPDTAGAAGDLIGISVAISGDVAVVGATGADNGFPNSNRGAAFVFRRTATSWQMAAKLTASDAAASDNFGFSVGISGGTIIVGAFLADLTSPARMDAGAAYVFVEPVAGWCGTMTQTAKLIASDEAANDQFGRSVAIDGDTVAIGAWNHNSLRGAVYVFTRPIGGGWLGTQTQDAKLLASDAATFDGLGSSVVVKSDTVIAGAVGDDFSKGSAYVFVSSGGSWSNMTETAKLTAGDGLSGDNFGNSLAYDGTTAVVGAWFDDSFGSNHGSAYVFVRPQGGWVSATQTAKVTAGDTQPDDRMGSSVAVGGDVVIVGADLDDGPTANDQGSVYFFVKPSGGWADMTHTAKAAGSGAALNDHFGCAAAISGGTAVIGANLDDEGSFVDSGSAYIFIIDSDGDGVDEGLDVCPHSTPGLTVDASGRPRADWNGDCLVDGLDIQLFANEALLGP